MKKTLLSAAVFAGILGCSPTQAAPVEQPNIIIILADDMGYGDPSSYGGTEHTPNIDELAEEGMKFTDFHTSGSVCSPTRAGLITGKYQQRTGVDGVINAKPNHPSHTIGVDPTKHDVYPNLLKEEGYTVGLFGKWHVGYESQYHPMKFGFDEFKGYLSGNIDYFSHIDQAGNHDWWHGNRKVHEEGYSTHLITDYSVKFIEKNKDKPFMLMVSHESVHYPWQGPTDNIQRGPNATSPNTSTGPEAYRAMLKDLDNSVGEIKDAVESAGIADNTLIIFTSDNGPHKFSSSGPFRDWKGTVYEGGHRVSTIAWQPNKIEAGSLTTETAMSFDLVPTMLELAGSDYDTTKLDGVSLVPALEGKKLKERDLFWRNGGVIKSQDDELVAKDTMKAVREGNWKLVAHPYYSKVELYNLADDRSEKINLANKKPEITARLTKKLKDWESEMLKSLPYKVVQPNEIKATAK
ncbi:TPA: sulfatase-like hydrolase/transferase [Vibrio parahaemolyticus]